MPVLEMVAEMVLNIKKKSFIFYLIIGLKFIQKLFLNAKFTEISCHSNTSFCFFSINILDTILLLQLTNFSILGYSPSPSNLRDVFRQKNYILAQRAELKIQKKKVSLELQLLLIFLPRYLSSLSPFPLMSRIDYNKVKGYLYHEHGNLLTFPK